jgi:purine-binding chemotaxis protein CheW
MGGPTKNREARETEESERDEAHERAIAERARQAILERRAERLRAPMTAPDDAALLSFARFSLGDDEFAIPVAQLRAAIPLRGVAHVPLAPPEVLGVVRFEGQVITAYSLASLLGGYGWTSDPSTLLVVEWGRGRLAALDCHGVPQTIALPPRALEAAYAHDLGGRERAAVIVVIAPDVPRPIRAIDLDLLFARVQDRSGGGA